TVRVPLVLVLCRAVTFVTLDHLPVVELDHELLRLVLLEAGLESLHLDDRAGLPVRIEHDRGGHAHLRDLPRRPLGQPVDQRTVHHYPFPLRFHDGSAAEAAPPLKCLSGVRHGCPGRTRGELPRPDSGHSSSSQWSSASSSSDWKVSISSSVRYSR